MLKLTGPAAHAADRALAAYLGSVARDLAAPFNN
jgi:hypothetical protein